MNGLLLAIARWLLRLVYRVEVRGEWSAAGRTLIVANHQSFLDGVLLACFLPVRPMFLVHTTVMQRWFFRFMLRAVRYEAIDTTKPIALKRMVALVEAGEAVVIFPEGRITVTGSLMKVYDGPAFVAVKTGCTIVPVRIDGAVYSPWSRMGGQDFPRKWFPKIRMTILPGTTIPTPDAPRARDRRRIGAERLRRILQETAYASRRQRTLWQALVEASELHGRGRRMLEDINTNFAPVDYATILKASLALGRLTASMTREREMVGVLMPNASATVYLMFGLTAFGRVPAMLNFTTGARGVQAALRAANVRLVITSRAFIERARLGDLVAGLSGVEILYLEDLRARLRLTDKLWILWATRNPRRAAVETRPGDPALVLFTSGSEGDPKGVVLSQDSLLANVDQLNAIYAFSSTDRFLSALPLFHAFGITGGVLVPLLKGCRVVLYPSPLHYRTIPEFVYDHDCTVLFTTNTFLAKYAQVAHPYDFHNLRHLVVGAEKLTDDVRKLCLDKFGLRVLEGYGATECSPVIALNSPLANRPGTVGEILPGLEHKLVPVEGIDEGGLLHVRGDNVMLGYLRADRPGEIQPVDGWYNTGDVVSMSGEFISIRARLKRFAKVAGEMVPLDLVEKIAVEAEPKAAHAASSCKDTARGEALVLFTESKEMDREKLKGAARRLGAPEIAIPRRIVHMDKLPILGNGKRDHAKLAQLASEPLVTR
jgi:acyl-[acyl-carrier-protein]-phospholipid O-acyltransferase / long-chain-fatty-acid--[acyl-carrier-protein] ligase